MLRVNLTSKTVDIPYTDGTYTFDDVTIVVNGSLVCHGEDCVEVLADEDYDDEEDVIVVNLRT